MPAERTTRANGGDGAQPLTNAAANGCGVSIDAALACQREDWLKGIRLPIADRLRACGALGDDPAQAAELIYHEVLLRRDSGETPDWDSLLRQFPESAVQLRLFREADEIVESAIAPSGRSATQLGGYDLLEEVGRGGMGVVYRARERNLDRTVAIKRVRAGALAADQVLGRFLKEAKAVSRLNHPNIVHIYCVSDCEGEPFIALEFVEGPTLAERIGGTPLAPRVAATIAAAVARAIQHAHQHGIIHRDLKPANILLSGSSDRPVPKVTDFGAAKELDHATDSEGTQFLGTPSYMAPEQVEPKWGTIGQLTDVYGIGAVLYESLTGRPPFRADSISETLRQVIETQPVSPRLLNPAVPRDLATVCVKCLEKDPAHRYDSAAALADDLARFVKGEPVRARPIGPGGRVVRWCRRNPLVASLTAVLVLALVGGIFGIARQWRQAEVERRNAVASDLEAQQLLSELIASNPVVPGIGFRVAVPSVEPLLKVAAHCKNHLQKNPGNLQLRIALTNVYGSLGTLYLQRRQFAEMEASFQNARNLWEPLVSDRSASPVYRDWLATTYDWEAVGGVNSDWPRRWQSMEEANRLWEELAEEQPANLDFMQKVRRFHIRMVESVPNRLVRDGCLGAIQDTRSRLAKLVHDEPSDRVLRKRLALTCLILGKIASWEPSVGQPSSFWKEAHDHYKILAEAPGDDILVKLSLGDCCRRLIRGQSPDPYYSEAVRMLEQAGRSLAALSKQNPARDWFREALLEDYCDLASCHSKVGRNADAAKIVNNDVQPLIAALSEQHADPVSGLNLLKSLCTASGLLEDGKQAAAALAIDRQAAALTFKYAANSWADPGFLRRLGDFSTALSTSLNQHGDARLALQMAELARDVSKEASRFAPEDFGLDPQLSDAWQRIGKAHWSLGARDHALAAFRESAALQKRVFAREPSNHASRARLSICCDRLVHYGSRGGDLPGAAAALLEREKLWPGDAAELTKIADDFKELADLVDVRAKGKLSPQDRAEKSHYLAESKRFRDAAKRKGAAGAPTVIGDRL